MIEPSVKLTFDDGPLERLNSLIAERQRYLHQGCKDATIATAITALQSIRKDTARHSPKRETVKISGIRVSISRRTDVHTSFTKGKRRCFRTGERCKANKRSPHVDMGPHCIQLCSPGAKEWRSMQIFRVQLSDEQAKRWPKQPIVYDVVAKNQSAVESYLSKRLGKIAQRMGGAAQRVLSLAMAQLSTRPTREEVGEAVKAKAHKFVEVRVQSGTMDESVLIRSNLVYAVDAVKGGQAGIDDSLKRAANRITGYINHQVSKWKGVKDMLPIPFPEVKRK